MSRQRRIGFAIARTLAREGAEVTITGRDREKLAAAVDEIHAAAPLGKIRRFLADISTAKGVEALTSQLNQTDILVNNPVGYRKHPKHGRDKLTLRRCSG
ncbi:SDR family NAD(P)-dependent oxidoreductase [Enterobacter sp. Bisph1]|uniref:SDR family NAD(P)-dependent oxidoreductase n=1 Tax=Enterobacter sp. Bisph1 TaxID=1274399 RepID=UPI000907B08E|nr:SDR family NAD(P)-dependent oxidoreductase [Enterobacter sp. Bisph1]